MNQRPYLSHTSVFLLVNVICIHDNIYLTVGINVNKRIGYWLVSDCICYPKKMQIKSK